MKYVTFLIDGMADYPIEELGNKTPIEYANTPNIDSLAEKATFGTLLTLPSEFPTSSDVANMSVLGWDLAKYYTGRGAIESYGAGIPLDDETVAFRLNLITIEGNILKDYSAGHISDEEAKEIIESLNQKLGNNEIVFKSGVSYRHLLYLKGNKYSPDIIYNKPDSSQGMEWEKLLPKPKDSNSELTSKLLVDLIYKSKEILDNHPINIERIKKGLNPANLIWPWSGGKKPNMPSFYQMYNKKGAIVSAVDVILGLGRLGQMEVIKPEGATGFIDTNYENKAKAAINFLKNNDFVYVHIEAADECAHLGDLKNKIKVIEDCDKRLIGTFLDLYKQNFNEPLRISILPDHPVPITLRKHTRDEVPFMISGDNINYDPKIKRYSEKNCQYGKYTHLKGKQFMELLFKDFIE